VRALQVIQLFEHYSSILTCEGRLPKFGPVRGSTWGKKPSPVIDSWKEGGINAEPPLNSLIKNKFREETSFVFMFFPYSRPLPFCFNKLRTNTVLYSSAAEAPALAANSCRSSDSDNARCWPERMSRNVNLFCASSSSPIRTA